MRLRIMMPWAKLLCLSILLTGCSVFASSKAKGPAVLHDSNIPIPHIYDKDGKIIEGYQGYADGFVTNTLKACTAIMDKAGVN